MAAHGAVPSSEPPDPVPLPQHSHLLRCVTSVAALRAAQEAGQASIDVPSNLYFYLTVHPETR